LKAANRIKHAGLQTRQVRKIIGRLTKQKSSPILKLRTKKMRQAFAGQKFTHHEVEPAMVQREPVHVKEEVSAFDSVEINDDR
jgi:hypothetical protein